MRGVPRERRAISLAPSSASSKPMTRAPRRTIPSSSATVSELSRTGMPKRSRSGVVSSPARVVAPIRVNLREIDLHRARRRPGADDEIELVVLHRGIEDFLHCRD